MTKNNSPSTLERVAKPSRARVIKTKSPARIPAAVYKPWRNPAVADLAVTVNTPGPGIKARTTIDINRAMEVVGVIFSLLGLTASFSRKSINNGFKNKHI